MSLTIILLYALISIYLNHRANQNYLKSFIDTRTPEEIIGDLGEDIVIKRINKLGKDFIIDNNVHLDDLQIDHLVVNNSLKLCFVIETKMWGGKITGSSKDDLWIQEKDGQIKYLNNPIKQNKCHCDAVRRSYQGYHTYNIVVFVKNKNVPRSRCIVDENGVRDYINKITKKYEK